MSTHPLPTNPYSSPGRIWWRVLLIPVAPIVTAFVAILAAFYADSIRDFVPTFWREWVQMTTAFIAQNTFWPGAGWCWHYEADKTEVESGTWMTWRQRFVWHDPVASGSLGWTWSLANAGEAAQMFVRQSRAQ